MVSLLENPWKEWSAFNGEGFFQKCEDCQAVNFNIIGSVLNTYLASIEMFKDEYFYELLYIIFQIERNFTKREHLLPLALNWKFFVEYVCKVRLI